MSPRPKRVSTAIALVARVPAGASLATLRRWIRADCQELNTPSGELSVALVGSAAMRRLNRHHRGKDRATNVLSFLYTRHPRGPHEAWGEIILCPPVARREAREQQRPYRPYLRFLVRHGLIHLLGYDHATTPDQARWSRIERQHFHD